VAAAHQVQRWILYCCLISLIGKVHCNTGFSVNIREGEKGTCTRVSRMQCRVCLQDAPGKRSEREEKIGSYVEATWLDLTYFFISLLLWWATVAVRHPCFLFLAICSKRCLCAFLNHHPEHQTSHTRRQWSACHCWCT
jgi:hypothetical protein